MEEKNGIYGGIIKLNFKNLDTHQIFLLFFFPKKSIFLQSYSIPPPR
jgi:hypothetical protein